MERIYSLTVAFCVTDETDLLCNAFNKISKDSDADEYIFVLSRQSSSEARKTVADICKNNDNCKYFFQNGFGLGNAIKYAIASSGGTHLIVWPSDDGMDAMVFSQMVRCSKENPEKIIKVSRWLRHGDFENYSKIRLIINFLSQKMFSLMYKSDLTDYTNPTQIAPISIYKSIKWENEDFSFIPEMVFKPLKYGCSFVEIPCKNTEQRKGRGNSRFFELAKYYFVILKIRIKD